MRTRCLPVLAILLLAVAVANAAPLGGLAVRLDVANDHVTLTDAVALTVTMTNDGSEPLSIARWLTAADGLDADLFEVTRDGAPVRYVGRLVKRAAPGPDDLLTLAPGASFNAVVDLSAAYEMSVTGAYAIRYRAMLAIGDVAVAEIVSDPVALWIEGRPYLDTTDIAPEKSIGGYYYCTNTQQSTLQTAHGNATTMASKGYDYLVATPNSTRYQWWFGAWTSARWNTVKSHFASIEDAFVTKNVTYDCSCTSNYYAYVYPNQPYRIYVCSVFWKAPNVGRDSKAGTLVHEMSHFYVVASTDDWVYGATGAHNLALRNPKKAIDNADNHEYFGEDSY